MSTAVLPEMAYSTLFMILEVVTQILRQRTSWQIRLLGYMLPHFGHVGVERACSEIGVPNICAFVRGEEKIPERPEIAQLIASARVALHRLDALQD
jgi:glucokinase